MDRLVERIWLGIQIRASWAGYRTNLLIETDVY